MIRKKEFLADVSSFANAGGGDLIYGVKEARDEEGRKTGEPEEVIPLVGATADEAKLRLEEIIRTGITPRIPVQIRHIAGYGSDGTGFIVLVRVPKSIASPHVVAFRGTFKFFSRNSAGKYQLDVNELRNAFLATDSQWERIKHFREERLGKILAEETPVLLSGRSRIVLHLIPITSFLSNTKLDLSNIRNVAQSFSFFNSYPYRRYNLDGIISHSCNRADGEINDGYCQLFFNGVLEFVEADIVRGDYGTRVTNNEEGGIASIAYERDLIQNIQLFLKGYKDFAVAPPIAISVALLGCKGSFLYVDERLMSRHGHIPIDRDVAILPEIMVENLDENIPQVMKPVFDAVWNACGYPRSMNYDQNGEWCPER